MTENYNCTFFAFTDANGSMMGLKSGVFFFFLAGGGALSTLSRTRSQNLPQPKEAPS